MPVGATIPTFVRVAPDSEYRSWGNEYAPTIWPVDGARATADFHVWVRAEGNGAILAPVTADFDLAGKTVRLTGCHVSVRSQAQSKAQKLLALIIEHMAARDAGELAPRVAFEVFLRSAAA